ncbi:hypothetical protein P692DRAFT_20882638 [Suillus brevipes Sb2]|nr:hypothetical protein P692DRAFT_20882638 [Suillus brevipes Sb2]
MSKQPFRSKKTAREQLEEEQELKEAERLEKEKAEQERAEAEKQRERNKEVQSRMTAASVTDPGSADGQCENCASKGQICTWKDTSHNLKIHSCDTCRGTKESCARHTVNKKRGRMDWTPSPKTKGRKHQKSPSSDTDVEIISNPGTAAGAEPEFLEYDDEAWVAMANSIVEELAWTNRLLEKSIQAAEGSRAAADQMTSGLTQFLEEQKRFFALFQQSMTDGSRMMVDRVSEGGGKDLEEEGGGEEGSGPEVGSSRGDMKMDT